MIQPVIIGVGDIKNKSKELREDGSDEPASLMIEAIQLAIKDAGLRSQQEKELLSQIDSIDVTRPWTWPYPDLAGLLADKLGVQASHLHVSPHGGNHPAKLLDDAARRISQGKAKIAIVTGGEALDSLNRYMKAGQVPPPGWTEVDVDGSMAAALKPPSDRGPKGLHGFGAPIQVYPLYENGFRAHHKQSFAENHNESAQLYSEFSKVAGQNTISWNHGHVDSKETIATVSGKNRMICLPYPLLMNAFNTVNLAGAVIVTSTDIAKKLGVDRSKWAYVLGGAGTAESEEFFNRTNFHSSPAIERSIDTALKVSGLTKDEIHAYDFYSCFPIVPKLACRHLGLPTSFPPKPITLLGGLTSFGGAGNNYSLHAITEMTRHIRNRDNRNGLILANGGVLSYQHVVCLSTAPPRLEYAKAPPLSEHVDDVPAPQYEASPEGEAVIETYTVDFHRDNTPKKGNIVGRLPDGRRFIANHADEETLRFLSNMAQEPIGKTGVVSGDKENIGRNLFSINASSRL